MATKKKPKSTLNQALESMQVIGQKYQRPHNTTANPDWHLAPTAAALIPTTDDIVGRGERMVNLIGQFLITQGAFAGKRLHEVMLPWQEDFIRFLFGYTDRAGRRYIRRCFAKMGKGSGKSAFTAAIALGFLMDCVARGVGMRGTIVIMSPSVATSRIIFGHLEQAIMNDPHLEGLFKSRQIDRSIVHVASGIEIIIKVPTMSASVGLRPLFLAFEEWHQLALEGGANIAAVIDQLRKGMSNSGAEGLEMIISTAPPVTSGGMYSQLMTYSRKVRNGEVEDPSFFPFLCEPPIHQYPNLDLSDPVNWQWGMPSLQLDGIGNGTMDSAEMQREFDEAQRTGDVQAMSLFLSQRLGVEPSDRRNVGGQRFQETWTKLPLGPMRPPSNADKVAVAFDPGGLNDLFSCSWAWTVDGDPKIYTATRQYLVEAGYERAPSTNKITYDNALKDGELTIYRSTLEMFEGITREVLAVSATQTACFGVYGGDLHGSPGWVAHFADTIGGQYHEVPQGWKLKGALFEMNAAASDGLLAHPHLGLLDWNVQNLLVNDDATSGRIFQKRDSSDAGTGNLKIDGIMSTLSAIQLLKTKCKATGIGHLIG